MSHVAAQSIADIAAPIDLVFAHASDFERMHVWQPDLRAVTVLARDAEGRPARVHIELDTPLRLAKATLEIRYSFPRLVGWRMLEGNVPSFEGTWTLEPLSELLTRVEYAVAIDFGKLGRLVRGAAAGSMGDAAVSSMPRRLKAHVEGLGAAAAAVAVPPGR